jgi:hypothetical protein
MFFLLQVKEMAKAFVNDWLPEKQLDWYKNNTCSLPKDIRVSILVLVVLTNSIAQSPSSDSKILQMAKYFSAS